MESRNGNRYTPEEDAYLIENYAKQTSHEISQALNRTASSIRARAVNVLKLTKGYRKYDFDHSFFENINTSQKAYIFGLWVADGCIFRDNTYWRFDIAQHIKSKHILEDIKSAMKYTGPLIKNGTQCLRLRVNSEKLCKDIIRLGGSERKSGSIPFPKIKKELMSHFIRGYFDGDGSVGIYDRKSKVNNQNIKSVFAFSMVGGEEFLTGVQNEIQKHVGVQIPIHWAKNGMISKEGKFGCLRTNGRNKPMKVLDWLYSNMEDNDLCLARKREIYNTMVKKIQEEINDN